MSSSPSGATTIPNLSSDLLRNQAQNNPVLTDNDNGNVMPLSPAAPRFEGSESQPVPPLTHTQATFNLTENGKAHTPSFATNSSPSFNDGFSNIQEKVSSGFTAAGQTASTYMNQAVVAGKNVAEKIKKATRSKSNENANSTQSDTTSSDNETSSSSSSSTGSLSSSISSGLNAAGHTASVLMNEALEASRGVAGRLTGTSSKPSDTEQDESSSSSNTNNNPSFQSKIVTGIENFSNSASSTWNDAMATSKSYAAAVDESLGVSSKIHYVDEKLGVSAAVTGIDKKAADTANHLYTSIKRGQPSHAINHATSVGAIGQAELKKHQKGPLPTTTDQSEEKHEIDMKERDNNNEEEEEPAESLATGMEEAKEEGSSSMKNQKLHELDVEDKPIGTRKGQDRKAKKQKRSAAA